MLEIFGILSVVLNILASGIYALAILKGETKPHFFTTLTWLVSCTIVFWAQLTNNGGPGAWATGCTSLFCLYYFLASFKNRADYVVKSDYIFLGLSILAIILYFGTKDALLSVIFCTLIDVAGFVPTIRKCWHHPYSEHLPAYVISCIKYIFSLLALSQFTFVTALFPATLLGLLSFFCVYLLVRRKALHNKNAHISLPL